MFDTVDNRAVITVGDRTSKGGVVLQGSPIAAIEGRPVARVGDKVSCPCNHCRGRGGWAVISSGTPNWRCDGREVARDGDFIDCGGVLMATIGAAGAIGVNASTVAKGEKVLESFDRRFALKCSLTGVPLAGQPYRLKMRDAVLEGITDGEGLTEVLSTGDAASEVTCEILGDTTHD